MFLFHSGFSLVVMNVQHEGRGMHSHALTIHRGDSIGVNANCETYV